MRYFIGRFLFKLVDRYPVVGWIIGMIGLGLLISGTLQLRGFQHIRDEGVSAQGSILAITGEENESGEITYTFDAAGRHYTGHSDVGVPEHARLKVGDAVSVKYLANDPGQSVTGASWPILANGLILGGSVFLLLSFSFTIRRRRLRNQAA